MELEHYEEKLTSWLSSYIPDLKYTITKFPSVKSMKEHEDIIPSSKEELAIVLFKEEAGQDYTWSGLYDENRVYIPVRSKSLNKHLIAHEIGHAITLNKPQWEFKEDWKSSIRAELESDLWSYNITGKPRKIRWYWESIMPNYKASRKDLVIFIREQLELIGAPKAWKDEFRRKKGGRY